MAESSGQRIDAKNTQRLLPQLPFGKREGGNKKRSWTSGKSVPQIREVQELEETQWGRLREGAITVLKKSNSNTPYQAKCVSLEGKSIADIRP